MNRPNPRWSSYSSKSASLTSVYKEMQARRREDLRNDHAISNQGTGNQEKSRMVCQLRPIGNVCSADSEGD